MKLLVVGIGPGGVDGMTAQAKVAIQESELVVGYTLYLSLIEELLAGKETIATAMRGEVERCRRAVEAALAGRSVVVVSGGDAGVYGMAGLCLELAADHPELVVEVIPGVTAACAAAAVLGAPLTHDWAAISLSDLLTDWAVIERRVLLAAEADFVLCFYNPASVKRRDHLARACAAVLRHRPPETPCGVVKNAGRAGQSARILTLDELSRLPVDMLSTVVVGNSRTTIAGGRLVTPRGYTL